MTGQRYKKIAGRLKISNNYTYVISRVSIEFNTVLLTPETKVTRNICNRGRGSGVELMSFYKSKRGKHKLKKVGNLHCAIV